MNRPDQPFSTPAARARDRLLTDTYNILIILHRAVARVASRQYCAKYCAK